MSEAPQPQIPTTTFHQVKIKVGQREQMPFMPHEEIGTGTQGGRNITVARNINGSLLMVMVGKSNYLVNVEDIVQGLIDYEDQQADPKNQRTTDMWPSEDATRGA